LINRPSDDYYDFILLNKKKNRIMSEKIAPRDVLGEIFIEFGEQNPSLVLLDADFNTASKIEPFTKRFPERFVQVGIAEQNMMGVAAGLSTTGFLPYACTLAAFCSRRACDQVMVSIALSNFNVKILGIYPGLFVGLNGASHQALEDIAIMRSMANMRVAQPADAWETREIIRYSLTHIGPMYIRIGRDPVPRFVPEGYSFELGKSLTLREGNDITLICYGELVGDTLEAAELLSSKGIHARVINMSSLKPVDEGAIIKAARETGKILTVDNHNIYGGVGSAVCELVSEQYPVRVKRVGVRDVFGKSGSNEAMKEKFGLRSVDIAMEAELFLRD
jgi:transketolase